MKVQLAHCADNHGSVGNSQPLADLCARPRFGRESGFQGWRGDHDGVVVAQAGAVDLGEHGSVGNGGTGGVAK